VTTFLIIALALGLVAPLFVAVPLLRRTLPSGAAGPAPELKLSVYRDQLAELVEDRRGGRLGEEEFAQARGELEQRLIDEMPQGEAAAAPAAPPQRHRALAGAAMVAVPLLAVALYFTLGNTAALLSPSERPHELGQQQIGALVARLAARLEKNPQDVKGWVMLARAQAVLGNFEEASSAYARSVALVPDDAQLLADYADALAMAQGGRLAGEPEKLVERALSADPDNAKALSLAGTIAYDNRDFTLAVKYWERLRTSIPPTSEFAESIRRSIDEAKKLAKAQRAGADVRPASDTRERR
jgi:cytochrome c-type biogenesis protein CcmH